MKGFIYSELDLLGKKTIIGFGDENIFVREIDKKLSKEIIIKNHYSHKVCQDATTRIHLGYYINNVLVGVLQFGYAMNPRSMDKIVKDTKIDEYLELNRMWIDDCGGRNSESQAISYSIKYIKGKFKKIKWIQSFADSRCNLLGIVYQAANFVYVGKHKSVFWQIGDEVLHNSRITNGKRNKKKELEESGALDTAIRIDTWQYRYVYFIKKQYMKDLMFKIQPYPKHYKDDN